MRNFFLKVFITLMTFCFLNLVSVAQENPKNTKINAYTGMFDFSDDKQKSGVFGLQHQNEDLFRNSFLGKISQSLGVF